ncbi:hypothetical protein VHEMI04412 [[Torrubiella] hemipterigena]|uniref:Uncharacterized protein n=1 Tax=[Torrubiella] hemipterigena TaxID=1531966 RepID=A0A0A1TDR0_9HYPO|nr:hypothetical protein VHEMI04412 [[Torrubiella] hemipterigena]
MTSVVTTAALQLNQPPETLLNRFPDETTLLIQEISSGSPNLATIAALMSVCGATLTPIRAPHSRTCTELILYLVVPCWASSSSAAKSVTLSSLGHISTSSSTYAYRNRQGITSDVTLRLVSIPPIAAPTHTSLTTRSLSARGCSAQESLRWSKVLAEQPTDAMGQDHFRFMGRFMAYGDAVPNAFEMLALEAFEQRLANSRRYGTWFAEQVSPGWRTGKPRNCYLERWTGVYGRLIWSFGIKGHPRADEIWHMMRERLPPTPDTITKEFFQDVSDMEEALRPETVAVQSWTFAYRDLEMLVFQDRRDNYFLCHAKSSNIPRIIRPRLTKLWNATLRRSRSVGRRLRSLAEFEWLWYWTNPFVRGGATTGSLLSAFMQRALYEEGVPIRLRNRFVMQDLYALTTDCRSYVTERVAQLAATKEDLLVALSNRGVKAG